jgi:hypothetical protein
MSSQACRPYGRLLFLLLLLAGFAEAGTPAKTTIADVVYRADGSPAGGVALISWPSFTTADGSAVAAGTKSVSLGTGGTLSVDLVPNSGAAPAATVYTVVFQLNDNTVRTEYWSVGTTSPTTIAAVRTTLGANASASQMATRQYVDTAVANRANDTSVVHVSGAETIAGVKQFSIPPSVPTPQQPTDAVNKEYVDQLVTNVGAGSYVSRTGDTMSGPLMLAGEAIATKDIVDNGKFQEGLSKVIDGTVQCLNASVWAKAK